ncbi:MAG TPA: hypothetical protein VFH80_10970, partial [Solirubrobacteraceae bacterium]|nr:hypothetical protein [Solirubrobacteraceae bacterium]
MSIASFRPSARVSRRSARQSARRRRARLALIVWWRGTDLDRRLAAGANPWASDELALRARNLISATPCAATGPGA